MLTTLSLVLALLWLAVPVLAVDTDEAIVQLVRETYDLPTPEYQIEVVASRLKSRLVDPADLTFVPVTKKEPLGLFTILVELARDGEMIEKGQVRLRISRFAPVLIAIDKIAKYDHLDRNRFELVRTDITNFKEMPISSLDELAGQRARRNIRKGIVLTSGAMEPVPDIELGGDVTIAYTDHWGSITAPGRAMEAGWVGSQMRVKNLATGKVVRAQVMADGSVEVNP